MFKGSDYEKYLDGLTDGQTVAFHKIIEWFKDYDNSNMFEKKSKQVFVLSGYAGTGKTFLMGVLDKFFREYYNNDNVVQATAFTGKASTVLAEKNMNASTLHRFLYIPSIETKVNKETGKKTTYFKWTRRNTLGNDIKLIIVDEVSMLPKKMFEDLKRHGLPILCVGDGFQLPAMDTNTNLLDKPDYTLTEITRQALDNSIIRLSMIVRNGGEVPYGDFGENVQVISKKSIYAKDYIEIIKNYDQFLVGTNKSRLYFNTLYRKHLLDEHYDNNNLPCVGEKIIVTQNNWDFALGEDGEFSLFNGLVGTVTEVGDINVDELDKLKAKFEIGGKEYISDWIVYDTGIFRESLNNAARMPYYSYDKTYIENDDGEIFVQMSSDELRESPVEVANEYYKKYKLSEGTENKINQIDFGYSISVHKFQGSEGDNVAVLDESFIFNRDENKEHGRRWIYTAITRAKKFLLFIK